MCCVIEGAEDPTCRPSRLKLKLMHSQDCTHHITRNTSQQPPPSHHQATASLTYAASIKSIVTSHLIHRCQEAATTPACFPLSLSPPPPTADLFTAAQSYLLLIGSTLNRVVIQL
ncbi:hypothetical protein E2C01_090389 [Portunus trituberculatus]|uniref:Uncharacterized protein n=1 Tax=Portunus trituberculatus TaxID=210409 RepID=A0A5B7JBB4_PORTR|nr:hypothetical protein [Portunus trituberculatus]